MVRRSFSSRVAFRLGSIGTSVALVSALMLGMSTPTAGASSGPFASTVVTVHQTPNVICRANGGSLSANAEADQHLGFSTTYPRDIHAGDTFNIKIRQDVGLNPKTQATGN